VISLKQGHFQVVKTELIKSVGKQGYDSVFLKNCGSLLITLFTIFGIYYIFTLISNWTKIDYKIRIYFKKIVSLFEYDVLLGFIYFKCLHL
jgi:hypothetical protein